MRCCRRSHLLLQSITILHMITKAESSLIQFLCFSILRDRMHCPFNGEPVAGGPVRCSQAKDLHYEQHEPEHEVQAVICEFLVV